MKSRWREEQQWHQICLLFFFLEIATKMQLQNKESFINLKVCLEIMLQLNGFYYAHLDKFNVLIVDSLTLDIAYEISSKTGKDQKMKNLRRRNTKWSSCYFFVLHLFFSFYMTILKHLTNLSVEHIYAFGNLFHMLNTISFKIFVWTLSLFSISSF